MNTVFSFILIVVIVFVRGQAKTFYVNSESQDSDSNPGDGICRTSSFKCTLKAAIDESNARSDRDKIVIPPGLFRTDGEYKGGLTIRERVLITGKSSFATMLTGSRNDRHFEIVNEKLVFGLRDGQIGAIRPSSGRSLLPIVSSSDVAISGAFLFHREKMFIADFMNGVHSFNIRTREGIQSSSDKDSFSYDQLAVNGTSGNGAGLTTPTALAKTKDGDLLVNNYQPFAYGIRRYDQTSFAYKGIFISPPDIVNSMITYDNKVYVTLVSEGTVSAYDAGNGTFLFSGNRHLSTPRDIAYCGGRILVVAEKEHAIVEFDKNLKYQGTVLFDRAHVEDPQGLACYGDADLFVKTKGQKLLHYRYDEDSYVFARDLSAAFSGNYISGLALITDVDNYGGPGVTLSKMTLTDGKIYFSGYGPSIAVSPGCWVKLDKCSVRNNEGSIFGGAITNYGTMIIEKCRVFRNTMPTYSLDGGGVTNSGGAIANFGKMEILNSEISNNTAARGGGIYVAGYEAHLTVYQSTISGNFAGNAGGGIYNARRTDVIYSTITENKCGKYSGDPASRRAGCGFYSYRSTYSASSVFSISSSIIAGNEQLANWDNYAPDCLAEEKNSVQTYGGNIIGGVDPVKCKRFLNNKWDKVGAKDNEIDPKLGALKKLSANGKLSITYAHEPQAGSLAVKFNPFGSGGNPQHKCPTVDQIGRKRPQNGICDAGAVERGI